ncbi:PLD nuclease N-terminal domain-containing protein [Paenibacillus guangzhouensis]|uniref:PLD nuclease N-terminal domain-containing protein n=1 Tax=Paenibacillus guangzhouensis TaxID=1473112 RepID=UPI00126764E1|nr:PLD nuclease N-terminal domain-containing protein [Paenibacillus guangzhouensis]
MNLTVNWGLLAPILVIQLILMVTALLSLYKAEATRGPKWMWVLIIVFGQILGPIVYFVVGRKDR